MHRYFQLLQVAEKMMSRLLDLMSKWTYTGRVRMRCIMRNLYRSITAQLDPRYCVATVVVTLLLGACAPTNLVVTGDPQLAEVRAVYVLPFASGDQHSEAATVMTHALKEQLKHDGIFQVVEDPKLADAYFKGMVGKWSQGGLDLKRAHSTVISGSLTLLNPARQRLWFAAAVQRDPLRLVAHGLFARSPSALASHWSRTVLQQLPGYAVKGRPDANIGREPGPLRPAS